MIETQECERASQANLRRSQASHPIEFDSIDWECFRIEAGMGNVSPVSAEAAMDEADRLFNDPDATLQEILPAARGVLAMLRYHAPRAG